MLKRRKIFEAAVETFEITCYMFPVEDDADTDWDKKPVSKKVQSIVDFDGAANGKVIITPSESLLTAMAGNMLGIDSPNQNQKEEALCEVANIIAGNIAPHFSGKAGICYIHPPQLVTEKENALRPENALEETVRVHLDEGMVDIKVLYQIGERND